MPASFPYNLPYKRLNLRKHPQLYRIGKGKQGLLPLWRFKDPRTAEKSSTELYGKFNEYKAQNDFVGMDMARKYIQMGFTRARRYANHISGRKYERITKIEQNTKGGPTKLVLPRTDPKNVKSVLKAEAAEIFKECLERVKSDEDYIRLTERHRQMYEKESIPEDISQFEENMDIR